jgi:hypothetical protein
MHYRHPLAGFAFDLPDEWEFDSAGIAPDGITIVMRLDDTRLLLQVRRAHGTAAQRLERMTAHLESVRASHIHPCPPPPFARTRDIVALGFCIAGHPQCWISVCRDGFDYTISHTDDWQDAAAAVDRLASSFVFPAPARIADVLPMDPVRGDAADGGHQG